MAALSRGNTTSSVAQRPCCHQRPFSLAAARDQAQEEYRAAAEQAMSVRQQTAVRACISAFSGCSHGLSGMSGGLTLSVGL